MNNAIKGGGRASLSESTNEALIDCLIELQEPETFRSISSKSSDHDLKRERKRFVKKLVRRHTQNSLTEKLQEQQTKPNTVPDSAAEVEAATNRLDLSAGSSAEGKVRLELVEAIYGKNKKNNSEAKSWKEGAKKIVVFNRSTNIKEMLKISKNKLRMKKAPARCFLVEKKIEMILACGDLRALTDGTTIYVTCQQEKKVSKKNEEEECNKNSEENATQEPAEDSVDPLYAVKLVYAHQRQSQPSTIKNRARLKEYPCLSDHFDQLHPLSTDRESLPAAASREVILKALDTNRVMIVCGATGCGKSTQIPQYLLEGMQAANMNEQARILVTQPRRVAATSLANRVAQEQNTSPPGTPGSTVGYHVRLDRAVSDASAKIVYCTVGILLRMLVAPVVRSNSNVGGDGSDDDMNIPLSHLSHLVLDEVHERDLNTDFCLTLLKLFVLARNKNIRIILMSATASSDLFVDFFSRATGKPPTIVEIAGRSYPVDINWISACQRLAAKNVEGWTENIDDEKNDELIAASDNTLALSPRASVKIDNAFIRNLIKALVVKQGSTPSARIRTNGAILVFLPGKPEIESLFKLLKDDPALGNCKILKLHSSVPRGEQKAAFQSVSTEEMKIVLATNVAETSITIPDVSHVIDTGRVKESRFNASTRVKELVTVWTSQASAKQRAGRAGRTCKGTCWRLYSETFFKDIMPAQTSPEILRTLLDELVLQVCLLYENQREKEGDANLKQRAEGVCPIRFLSNVPEAPSDENLVEACKHLLEVGALQVVSIEPTTRYRLTPLGYHLSRLPMDTKIGKVMVVGCMLKCLDNSLTIAATLSATKSCFLSKWGSAADSDWWKATIQSRNELVESGFGGRGWKGGCVKGDLIACIAVYLEWRKRKGFKEKMAFCKNNGLDLSVLQEIDGLRSQFKDCLVDAGFLGRPHSFYNEFADDALLTSCCLVAGLHPNICSLMRPRKGGPKGGRLVTKNGESCKCSSSSFQASRLRNASEKGKDAYAVFHAKHRSVGTGERPGELFLSEVNFVSRFALLLFGGDSKVKNNALVVDGWLKFKIGDTGSETNAVLVQELRKELDLMALSHVAPQSRKSDPSVETRTVGLLKIVRRLLAED